MVRLLLAPVVEPPKNSSRMNRVFSIFLLLPVMAMVIRRKTIRKCVRQHKRGILGSGWALRRVRPSSGPSCQDGGERLHRQEGVYDVVLRSDAAEKGCRVIRTRWVTVNKGSDDAPQLRARWVGCPGVPWSLWYFSETPDLSSVKAVIAHAALRAESEDTVVAVFDVRRAYVYAEEKRDTFVELPDNACWEAAQGVVRNSPSCSIVGR